jgi:hypothetical protein
MKLCVTLFIFKEPALNISLDFTQPVQNENDILVDAKLQTCVLKYCSSR